MPSQSTQNRSMGRVRQIGKILVSGFLFSLLGLGGILLSLGVVPLLRLLPGGRQALARHAGWLIHRCFGLFVFALEASGILRVEVSGLTGAEGLGSTILVANHPSYLDVVVLIGLLPSAICVVKQAVYDSFFFGGLVRAAGFVPISGSEAMLEGGRAALASGKTLVIFPEGTRSLPGHPLKFQRGAAHLALATGARILPVVITCTPALLSKGSRWYHVPIETCQFRLRAGACVPSERERVAGSTDCLIARQMIEDLERTFNQEIQATD